MSFTELPGFKLCSILTYMNEKRDESISVYRNEVSGEEVRELMKSEKVVIMKEAELVSSQHRDHIFLSLPILIDGDDDVNLPIYHACHLLLTMHSDAKLGRYGLYDLDGNRGRKSGGLWTVSYPRAGEIVKHSDLFAVYAPHCNGIPDNGINVEITEEILTSYNCFMDPIVMPSADV